MPDFEYQYAQVRVTRFTERDAPPLGADYEVGYNVEYDLAFAEEASVLVVLARLQVRAAPAAAETEEVALAELESENVFALRGLDSQRGADGRVRLARPFVAQCIGIAFSTARGLLIGRARAELFGNAPLPVISPMELLGQLSPEQPIGWLADA